MIESVSKLYVNEFYIESEFQVDPLGEGGQLVLLDTYVVNNQVWTFAVHGFYPENKIQVRVTSNGAGRDELLTGVTNRYEQTDDGQVQTPDYQPQHLKLFLRGPTMGQPTTYMNMPKELAVVVGQSELFEYVIQVHSSVKREIAKFVVKGKWARKFGAEFELPFTDKQLERLTIISEFDDIVLPLGYDRD